MHFFRQTLKRLCQSTLPRRWMMFHGPRGARSVALTFDDGPHPVYTPQLLDELARLEARATFFVLGEQAAQHPDLVRRIHDEGHTLGHHTWTHADPSTPASQLFDEVRDCRELLESLTGEPCNLFRPPRGHLTFAKTIGLWRQHQQIVLWNVDPEDCAMPSREAAHTWAQNYTPHGGDVVLLHDDHPHIVPLVQAIVEQVKTAGLTTTTVSDWNQPARVPRISNLKSQI